MKHNLMIKRLIEEGLLDKDHNLTTKGHEYVETIKREYKAKTIAAEERIRVKEEKIEWSTTWS